MADADPKVLPHSLFIDGAWVAPQSATDLREVINPSTGRPAAHLAFGDVADVDLAVEAAHRALPEWSRTPLSQRLALLERICAVYERRLPELAMATTLEMGAPLHSLSLPLQAPIGLWHLQVTAAAAQTFAFDRMLNATTRILREPVGVCALITPWNWPLNQVVVKVAPALAVGCTMVLKPSQNSPLSAAIFAEILAEAGVPAGVFNMVQGEGGRLGERLASHPLVDMVSLTGSNAAGVSVARAAAATMKRVSFELGGKSANIILADADLDAAVAHGVATLMMNTGQSCNAPSRLLVPAARLAEAERIAAAAASALVVGDPLAPETQMGPVANARQHRRVQAMIQQGLAEGATLVAGGPGAPEGRQDGYFARPTVLSGVDNAMAVAREEIFGPVLVIIPYQDEDQAVAIANDSPFGLSGYVWASDREKAAAVAARLSTGMVHLNGAAIDLQAPFGGYKQSGNGREWGAWGLEDFLETKAVMGAAEPA
jgi:acyl-CoA reductase-like NAD-dependent aldehyde dehydrogenase